MLESCHYFCNVVKFDLLDTTRKWHNLKTIKQARGRTAHTGRGDASKEGNGGTATPPTGRELQDGQLHGCKFISTPDSKHCQN